MESTQIILCNLPFGVRAEELAMYLHRKVGIVDKCKVKQPREHLPAHAFVHFVSADVAAEACRLAERERLVFQDCVLKCCISDGGASQQPRKKGSILELRNVQLHMGYLTNSQEITLSWRGPKGCIFRVDLDLWKMYIFFDHIEAMSHGDAADLPCDFKLELTLKDLRLVREVQSTRGHKSELAIMLQLWTPPLISYKAANDDVYLSTQAPLPDDEDPWIRTIDFTPDKSIGRCLTYIISVSPSEGTAFRKVLEYFRVQRLCKSPLEHITCPWERKQDYQRHDFFLVPKHNLLSFNEMFLVNALVHRGILNVTSLTDEFYMTVKSNPPLAVYALQQMLTYTHPVYSGVKRLQQVMERAKRDNVRQERKALPPGCMVIRRLIFTPTRAFCLPPEVEKSNRVLRHFHHESDRFLRVSFVDDDLQKLSSSALTIHVPSFFRSLSLNFKANLRTEIYHKVLKILKKGFVLCGRRYSFLAFSANQLREGSLWFFAGDAHQIRKWMGQFPTTNVARYAARMGHCFSSTTATLKVGKEERLDLPDVERNGYTFSDGCGRIAPVFASQVAKMLNLSQVPTAYQIRYAGYKGVATVWPIEPALHTRYKLGLRHSMHKFESGHTDLEVIGWTQFYPGYLNREIISLLSTLQVPNEVFEALQDAQLTRLDALLHDPAIALEVLMTTCTDDLHSTAVTMLQGGFSPISETHLYNMLLSIRTYQLEDLVAKARIFVPQGGFLMGCMDETGLLQYGQCFIQVTGPASKDCFYEEGRLCTQQQRSSVQIITGKVIMAKNPCLHPGDIRILEAVDVPMLHGMVDCLVLPQNGPRPHPDEASGSDLDGDVYFVSWDADLMPPSGTSWEPMNYKKPKPRILKRVNIEDVMDFFASSMLNDSLGVICHAHVVQADRSPHGALDENCLHLAQLAAMAVDYPKTGVVATLPFHLRPKLYPDFLQKDKKITYQSEKIIGILYRKVSKIVKKEVEQLEQASHSPKLKSMYDTDLQVTGYEAYLEDAWATKVLYDQHLLGLMGHFNVKREADVVTGCVAIRKSSLQHGDLKDRIKAAYKSLRNDFRAIFDPTKLEKPALSPYSSASSNPLTREEVVETSAMPEESINFAAKASAWYHVTYHPDWIQRALDLRALELRDVAEDDSETISASPLLSFAWLPADVLAKIKLSKLREPR